MSGNILEQVRSRCAAATASGLSGGQAGVRAIAEAFGYTRSKGLTEVPAEADAVVGMGCGNEGRPPVQAVRREEWAISDPKDLPSEQYRAVRDRIEAKVEELLASPGQEGEKAWERGRGGFLGENPTRSLFHASGRRLVSRYHFDRQGQARLTGGARSPVKASRAGGQGMPPGPPMKPF